MTNFHIQFLFQAATENYSIQRAANNNAFTILGLFKSYGEYTEIKRLACYLRKRNSKQKKLEFITSVQKM